MLNYNLAASYKRGSFQQGDGRHDLITAADGQQVLNIASSNLPVSVNLAKMQSTQLMNQAGISYQKGSQQTESSAKNMADTLNKSVELSNHIATNNQAHEQFSDSQTIDQTAAVNKTAQMVKDFSDEHTRSTTKAAQILAAVSCSSDRASVGLFIGQVLGITGVMRGSISGQASIQNVYRAAEKIIESKDFQTSLRDTSQLAHNQSFAKNDDEGKRLADSISHSWNQSNSFRREASKSFTEAENYQKLASVVENYSEAINANYNQQFIEWLSQQRADNTFGGHIGIQGAAYIMAHKPELAVKYAERFIAKTHLAPAVSELPVKSPENLKADYIKEHKHMIVDVNKDHAQNKMDKLKIIAQEQGLIAVQDHNLEAKFINQQQVVQQELKNEGSTIK
jgi:conjugal transfer mating pair stabilization protein TraG